MELESISEVDSSAKVKSELRSEVDSEVNLELKSLTPQWESVLTPTGEFFWEGGILVIKKLFISRFQIYES